MGGQGGGRALFILDIKWPLTDNRISIQVCRIYFYFNASWTTYTYTCTFSCTYIYLPIRILKDPTKMDQFEIMISTHIRNFFRG